MKKIILQVLPEDTGKRLDVFVTGQCKKMNLGVSREFVQKLIQKNNCLIKNSSLPIKPHTKLKEGDEIALILQVKEKNELKEEDIALDVIYEDKDIIVINKPVGLVVHPAPGNSEHTLVNALLFKFRKLSDINPERPGIVHRLDKDTSGVLVIARNNHAHLILAEQFAQHSIKRKYVALVRGRIEFDEGVIELPIARHPIKRKNMAVSFSESSKYAKTHYKVIKRKKNFTFLELTPHTGRTHQLRVHLSHINHPILGDIKYGKASDFLRLALHAKSLGFTHPTTGKFVEFSVPEPKEFREFINKAD